MKKSLVFLLILLVFSPKHSLGQNNGAVAAAAAVGGLIAIGAGIAAAEQMKEQAELNATEWVLSNHPEFDQFSLSTLDFDGKKVSDLSATSVITFKIKEFEISEREPKFGKRWVLFGFTSFGWINEYGIDFNKVRWYLIDTDEWMNMMVAYTRMASGIEEEQILRDALINGKVVNTGVNVKRGDNIEFYRIQGDLYLVTDYSPEMKFIYNERSLGIYLKETSNLVQIARGNIIEIHEFFMSA